MDWKAVFMITKAKVIAFIILEVVIQILIFLSLFFISKQRIFCIQAPCPQIHYTPLWQLYAILTLLSTILIIVLIYLITFLNYLFKKT